MSEALRHSPLAAKVGNRDLLEDAERGFMRWVAGNKIMWNDLTRDYEERDEWRAINKQLPQMFGGSTGRAFRGGWEGFAREAAEGAGGTAPQALMAVGTAAMGGPAASTTAKILLNALSYGSMGGSSYGQQVDQMLTQSENLAQQADAAERAGDHDTARSLRDRADRVKDNYRILAGAQTGAELLSEVILPEHKLLAPGRKVQFVKDLGKSGLEGLTAGLLQAPINQMIGQPTTLEDLAKGSLLEAVSGAPLIGTGALLARPGQAPASTPNVPGPTPTPTVNPANLVPGNAPAPVVPAPAPGTTAPPTSVEQGLPKGPEPVEGSLPQATSPAGPSTTPGAGAQSPPTPGGSTTVNPANPGSSPAPVAPAPVAGASSPSAPSTPPSASPQSPVSASPPAAPPQPSVPSWVAITDKGTPVYTPTKGNPTKKGAAKALAAQVPPGETLDPDSILAPGEKPKPPVKTWGILTDKGTPLQVPITQIKTKRAALKALAALAPPGETIQPDTLRLPGKKAPKPSAPSGASTAPVAQSPASSPGAPSSAPESTPLQSLSAPGGAGGSPKKESPGTKKPPSTWKLGPLKLPRLRLTGLTKLLKTSDLGAHHFTPDDVTRMHDQLRSRKAIKVTDVVSSITDYPLSSPFTKARMSELVQDFLNHLPASMREALKARKVDIKLLSDAEMDGVLGAYQPPGKPNSNSLCLNAEALATEETMRETLYHELGHWVSMAIPEMQDAITEHVRMRTQGFTEKEVRLYVDWFENEYPDHVRGMRDDFRDYEGNEYMARGYAPPLPKGAEIASVILQTLAFEPDRLASFLNYQSETSENGGRSSWLETYFTVMQFIY